ncbi:hypothetical protein ACSTK1_16760 [Vibrio parahaemolyticus]|nr:hypothetical protein [Vibrio parahaemolyticus]EIV8502200.1 hypothetical protein [Vibrio parahaemolyticus]MBE4332193.1 hypothetical protein [Vibrio parahaemolyticus]MBE4345798.1 hypothetical protein [Vibrio parahaemolyticus]MDF4912228.1 hypothetical protein [Vibrio parahaemolyticus]OOX38838.1 hypothetical protein BJL76_22505 [Vibrio parahaemolyticus]
MSICKYCGENEAIENSHIIPSFICSWVKETSPTKVLRRTDNPNIRHQDGIKQPILCPSCEVEFSTYEDEFKKSIFSKVANYRRECPEELFFSENAYKCIVSIAWRALASAYYYPVQNDYHEHEFEKFPEFLDVMKSMIQNDMKGYNVHFIPCTRSVIEKLNLPKVDFTYYDRSFGTEARIWDDWERFVIYIKIPFGIFVVEIVEKESQPWKGTHVQSEQSFCVTEITEVPEFVHELVQYFYNAFLESIGKVTDKQREVMQKSIDKFSGQCGAFKTLDKSWEK